MTVQLEIRRIIIFTADMAAMSAFYGQVLGLALLGSEEGWRDYDAGACRIALHNGTSAPGRRPPKLVFFATDVAAARAALVRRGVKTLGKVKSTGHSICATGRTRMAMRFRYRLENDRTSLNGAVARFRPGRG